MRQRFVSCSALLCAHDPALGDLEQHRFIVCPDFVSGTWAGCSSVGPLLPLEWAEVTWGYVSGGGLARGSKTASLTCLGS